ncbi:hypothetical protein ACRAWD_23150 [Caulobacter segnis]
MIITPSLDNPFFGQEAIERRGARQGPGLPHPEVLARAMTPSSRAS